MRSREAVEAWLGRVGRPYAFTSPFGGGEFALLLVVGDDDISPDEQWSLSQELVRQGCRYAVCFGHDASSWDDSIDMVGVMNEIEGSPSPFVMTTWHEREPIDEVVRFFADCTRIDERVPERFAVLVLGGSEHLETDVRAAVRRRFAVVAA